jgi:hypothetical protein
MNAGRLVDLQSRPPPGQTKGPDCRTRVGKRARVESQRVGNPSAKAPSGRSKGFYTGLRVPNTPCGLNPSSPIILFKAAAIASRSLFWLLPKLRRGRRPVVVEGKVRLAFIVDTQADLARSEKVRFV